MHRDSTASIWSKVPEVTLGFWAVKILSTTVGETGADYLAVHLGWGATITSAVMAGLLALTLLAQVLTRRYEPPLYWLTVVLVSVVGTQLTDILTDKLGVSLWYSTAAFGVLLATLFFLWHRREGTLSIQSIVTRRRELWYWAAILCTFALGTAAGDLATEALGLGFRFGTLIFSLAVAISALAYCAGASSVLTFWLAYILTRPLGASLGDLLAQAEEYGGLGLGTQKTSLIFLAAIVLFVAWFSINGRRAGKTSSVM